MKAYNKIGFHTAAAGNAHGIGDYVRALDKAGIPCCIVSADGTTGLSDAVALIKNGSNVPHVLCWRRVMGPESQGRAEHYSVPKYQDPPDEAAVDHWNLIKSAGFPNELLEHRDKIWLLPINEIRARPDTNQPAYQNMQPCDWLGRFSIAMANLAHAEGFKVSMFAWSSGEPEKDGWEQPGMLDYLRLCAERPEQAAVALHEYSYTTDDILDGFPNKVGRFQLLFDVCDENGIDRPTTHITEWGWTQDRVPGPNEAIADMKKVGEIYAKYPNITGAAIWYLGRWHNDIDSQTQKLIKPVTDFTLNHSFEVTVDKPRKNTTQSKPASTGTQGGGRTGGTLPVEGVTMAPDAQPNALFVTDVTIPDHTQIDAGATFTKTWRMRNSGNVAWGDGYKLVFVKGTQMRATNSTSVPVVDFGAEGNISVELIAPTSPGTYESHWRLQDPAGNFFGDFVFTVIESVGAPPPSSGGTSNSAYVADVTIPDNTQIAQGQGFTKTWRVKNNGTRTWGQGFTLSFLANNPLGTVRDVPLTAVSPNEEVNISVPLTAPSVVGTYRSDWRMKDENGNYFGEELFTIIEVVEGSGDDSNTGQSGGTDVLEVGMNINPDAPHSNPVGGTALDGADWVRFVFKMAARQNPAERNSLEPAFAQYDPLIRKYDNMGIKSLIVLNQETVWANAPWSNGGWDRYADELARFAGQIAAHYKDYGSKVAYEIWNEGDLDHNAASIYIEPETFAPLLKKSADAIRAQSPDSPIIFGGMATGPNVGIPYLKRCLTALGGTWPVDAIGIHPYGRWGYNAPFDWGQQFGTLGDAFEEYAREIPGIPFWITEIGVADDNEIGPQHYDAIANYVRDSHQYMRDNYTHLVPVLIWFAWSDWMRNAGVVNKQGGQKSKVYTAYQDVLANRRASRAKSDRA